MRVVVLSLAVLLGSAVAQHSFRFPSSTLSQIRPIAGFPDSRIASGPVRSSGLGPIRGSSSQVGLRQSSSGSGDPCRPTPCGPNTSCSVNARGIAQCKCLDNFVPDGNTINGCKPQCVSDFECPDDYRCRQTKCERVCVPGACGLNADCDARNHRAVCTCPKGYAGSPEVSCNKNLPVVRANPPAPPPDPCFPSPCGDGAECRERDGRAVCTCPYAYEGDPLTRCTRVECVESSECPTNQACQQQKCINPCTIPDICGRGSECTVRNHQPVCSCGRGFTGDPFVACRRFDPQELCQPSPCGANTNCRVENDRAVCSCIDNYIGNPLEGCRAECVSDRDCPGDRTCRDNRCVNPCAYNACGENSYCDVRNNRVTCTCPQFFQGDPHSRCFAECTEHDDCSSSQACFELRCIDPCVGACGTGADCKVENHKPICSCPKGFTGHPFESCRPFTEADLCNPNPCGTGADCTPGHDRSGESRPVCTCPIGDIGNPLVSCQRGECQSPNDCAAEETCHAYHCQSACFTETGSVCGELADCTVRNHQPVCSCPPGYSGDPLRACYTAATSRFASSARFSAGRT
ncbi:neurogenic locus notch homolog protein 1 isoform X2 [Hyalella azteca]|uniref:Neurogenic locus notch homolog protein 1 isoform X2 n=1 Tax=Hyalella azteca TaxID=294128 RepID=A0A8B7NGG4_HYAAZ|nr:neurogenic locus notch homolog protein 1 isoform X2 [Hyalella azteca]